MSFGTDKDGRRLNANSTPNPRWKLDPDFIGPCQHTLTSFIIFGYVGYFRAKEGAKGHHKYMVMCRFCKKVFERGQSSIMRSERQGCTGCHHCAKTRHNRSAKEVQTEEGLKRQALFQEWLWATFLMPVTTLRIRAEMGKCFDSEKSRVLGWRMI